MMGEIKDASEGLSVIESRCNVNENPRITRLSKLTSVNEDISSSAKPSEIQKGFNKFHSTTPLIPASPANVETRGINKQLAGCQQGKSLYIAIISRQLKRLGDAAPMAGKSVRET